MNLFDPLKLRDVTLRNRIAVSPMCQYSCEDGAPNNWHLVHLGSRAIGGAGLVIAEASAVVPEGRISPADAGLYKDEHVAAWAPITKFITEAGSVAGIQLAHAGRKASTGLPWEGGKPVGHDKGGWSPVHAPSALAFDEASQVPKEMSLDEIRAVVAGFRKAAERALAAGFQLIEIHGAHGYLLHEFLSPLSNHRKDDYGGNFRNRTRLVGEVIMAVREVWPHKLPLLLRISATDWAPGDGWEIEQSIELARFVKPLGVDLIDVSSGGMLPKVHIPVGPSFQVPFAKRIREEAKIATGAVGVITDPAQAQQIVEGGDADMVLLAREMLRDPYWPRRAAQALKVKLAAPKQYGRAW